MSDKRTHLTEAVMAFIEEMTEEELCEALGRDRFFAMAKEGLAVAEKALKQAVTVSDDKATIAFIRQHDADDRAQLKNNPHLPVMLSVVDREYLLAAVDRRDAEIASLKIMVGIYEAQVADLEESDLAQDHEIAKLRECAEAMAEALENAKQSHLVVDGDCWYSCPESGQCCDEEARGCRCGAIRENAVIDAVLYSFRASFPKPEAKGEPQSKELRP